MTTHKSKADDKGEHAAVSREAKRQHTFTLLKIGTAIALLNVLVVILVFALRDDSVPSTEAPVARITPAPTPTTSLPPSEKEMKIKSLLPNTTLPALEDPQSPQSLAMEYLKSNSFLLNYSDDTIRQKFALATFYYATNGSNWTSNPWLIVDAERQEGQHYDECVSWVGHVCDALNHSTEISLDKNGLQGTIPVEFYWLEYLQKISLGENAIQGTISSNIGLLSDLEIVQLPSNQISEKIPSEIGLLTNLQKWNITGNQLSSDIPTEVGKITGLWQLLAADNRLSGTLVSELGALTKLNNLDLKNNNIRGTIPTEIGNLGNLYWLYLSRNALSGALPVALTNLSNLWVLDVSHNELRGSLHPKMAALADFPFLDAFNISGNVGLWGEIPVELCSSSSLVVGFDCSTTLCGCQCPCAA